MLTTEVLIADIKEEEKKAAAARAMAAAWAECTKPPSTLHYVCANGGELARRTVRLALIATIKMGQTARRVAVANLCFNTFGVLLILPFLGQFASKVVDFAGNPGMAVAWAQLIFNFVMTAAVLVLLRIFQKRLAQYESGGEKSQVAGVGT